MASIFREAPKSVRVEDIAPGELFAYDDCVYAVLQCAEGVSPLAARITEEPGVRACVVVADNDQFNSQGSYRVTGTVFPIRHGTVVRRVTWGTEPSFQFK